MINAVGYEVVYHVEAKIGPFTIATAKLYAYDNLDSMRTIVVPAKFIGYGISRCSTEDKQSDVIGNQVAIGRAMTAALWRVVDPDDEAGSLSQISPLMAAL